MKSLKKFLFLLPAVVFICGCVTDDVTPTPGGASAPPAAVASVEWKTVPLSGGAYDVYVQVNGRDYLVERAGAFNRTSRGQFASMGVPANAAIAAMFWEEDADEEDGQGIYAAIEGSNVVVYTGYYVPGAMHDVDWRRKRSISF